jgi:hypothetical protein
MQKQTSTIQRDAPGQDTGRSQGHLIGYLLGGAPGERHRARCKTDSRGCDTHCGGLDERPTQNPRSTGQETHRATVGRPGQTGNVTMTRNQLVEKKPDGKEPRNTHHRAPSGDRSRPADVRTHEEGEGLTTGRARGETKTAGGQQNRQDWQTQTLSHRDTQVHPQGDRRAENMCMSTQE